MASMTDYEKGRQDGFCGIEARYPNNANYMAGHKRGTVLLLKECADTEIDVDHLIQHN